MIPLQHLRGRVGGLSARSRAVGMFFATSLAARGVGIGCQLLQVPIAIRALGPEAFGLWMTLTGAAAMIMFADLGLGQGAQNRIAAALARGADDEARGFAESALVFLLVVAAAIFTVAALALRMFDATALFNLRDPGVSRQASGAMLVASLVFCLNFPAGFAQRLALARQQGWIHNAAQAAGSVFGLAGIAVAAARHWPLPGYIAAAQTPLVAANAVVLILQLAQLKWLAIPRLSGAGRRIRELLGIGAYFGAQQIQLVLSVALPQVIISTTLGAAAVTPYNLAQRIFNLFAVVQNAFMLPLWPAYSEAGAKGEFAWIRRALSRSLAATVLCTVLPMAAGAAVLRPVVGLWIGRAPDVPGVRLVWLLFAWNALTFLQQPFGYMLAGLSVVKRQTVFAIVSAGLSTVLMASLVRPFGSVGVVLGMLLGFLPFLVFGNVLEARRVLRTLPSTDQPSEGHWGKEPVATVA